MEAKAMIKSTDSNDVTDRLILITTDIEDTIVGDIVKKIYEINNQDDEKEAKEVGFVRKPIKVIVNSFGGSIYDGFGIVGAIQASKTPVHTICVGYAMSMGFLIFAAGHKRFCHDMSTFMYHQLSGWNWGKLQDLKLELAEKERIMDLYDAKLLSLTKMTREQLQRNREKKEDWFIPADEAIKLGIADEIITR
jgi:ATP-dependent Clp protease protease subunit